MSLIKMWKKHFLFFELIISFVLIGILIWFCDAKIDFILNTIRLQLYGTISGISGALLGFVIAGLSVLLAINDNEQIKILKASPYFKLIYGIFLSTSKYLAFTTIMPLLGMIIDTDTHPQKWVTYVIVWSLIISFLRLARCFWVLEKMIELKLRK